MEAVGAEDRVWLLRRGYFLAEVEIIGLKIKMKYPGAWFRLPVLTAPFPGALLNSHQSEWSQGHSYGVVKTKGSLLFVFLKSFPRTDGIPGLPGRACQMEFIYLMKRTY